MKRNLFAPTLTAIVVSVICMSVNGISTANGDYTMRIVCIGDSITQGRGTEPQTQSYRYPLWKMLVDDNAYFDLVGSMTGGFDGDPDWPDYMGLPFDRDHEGHWGWTTDGIRDNLIGWLAGYTPDIALILLGTNDTGTGDTVADIKEEMRDIVDILRADNPDVIIIIGQPFQEWDPFPALAAAYADLAAEETEPNSPVSVVAHAPGWISNPDLPGTHTVDWVHPNVEGDLKLATNWFEAMEPYIISSDDFIDWAELEGMAADWMLNDSNTVVYAVDPCTTGLYAWWRCDEGAGNITHNQVPDGNNGTIYYDTTGGIGPGGSVWYDDPCRGMVLSFDGRDVVGAYVDAGTIPQMNFTNDFTWAFWAKQDSGQTYGPDVIVGNNSGGTSNQFIKFSMTKFWYNKDGFFGFDYNDIPSGEWIHHAVVKDGTDFAYYRNGILEKDGPRGMIIDPNPFYIGGDALGLRWRGYISDVRLYERALSLEEVMYLAEYPVHYYPIPSAWNWYDQEPSGSKIINFKDFAILANYWMDFKE